MLENGGHVAVDGEHLKIQQYLRKRERWSKSRVQGPGPRASQFKSTSELLNEATDDVDASFGELLGVRTVRCSKWRRLALVSLVVFTVAATLLFKVWPKVKYYGLLANVSVAGGLALAATM